MTYDIDQPSEQPPEEAHQAPSDESGEILQLDVACVSCGYNLQGLRDSGKCPECGEPIERSLKGELFEFASTEYVAKLYSGSKLVIASILFMVILAFGSIGFQMFVAFGVLSQAAGRTGEFVASALGVLASFMGAYGWWQLSEPNPQASLTDQGVNSRKLVRAMVVTNVIIGIITQVVVLIMNSQIAQLQGNTAGQPGAVNKSLLLAGLVVFGVGLIGLVTFAVAFFAQMKYMQWIGPRLPNPWVTERAKLMMWLGPLLYTVGAFCFGLGPLVALILYYNLITKARADLKHILAAQRGGVVSIR